MAAVNGDTAWYPMECRLWKSDLNHWCRLVNMDDNRLNKKKVQVGKDQEKAQSEKDSHSKIEVGKNQTNNQVLIP